MKTILSISAWVFLNAGVATQVSLAMPRKGKIVGVNLSGANRGASAECSINVAVSTSSDTSGLFTAILNNPFISNSVIAALVGYSLPPATGGNGPNVNQFFPQSLTVDLNQLIYFSGYSSGAEGRVWIIIYLEY